MQIVNSPETKIRQGFTLIELSIVLVIIGLIVGGVLTGQDLIKAAQIRATVSQLESYNTSVNTFRSKYNGIPGDLQTPTNFFPTITTAPNGQGAGLANGNGLVEGSGTDIAGLNGETAAFWSEMAQANLIPDSIANVTTFAPAAYAATTSLPQAKIGKGNYIQVVTDGSLNYFTIAVPIGNATTAASGEFTAGLGTALTPQEAFQIDNKLDDGIPNSGVVVSAGAGALLAPVVNSDLSKVGGLGAVTASLVAGDCWDSSISIYATDSPLSKNTNGCALRIRSNF